MGLFGSAGSRRTVIRGFVVLGIGAFAAFVAMPHMRGGRTLPIEADATFPIAISQDGQSIAAVGSQSDIAQTYDLKTRQQHDLRPAGQTDWMALDPSCYGMAISPDGKTLVTGGNAPGAPPDDFASLNTWEIATGKHVRTIVSRETFGPVVLYSPDGRNIVTGGNHNDVFFWDAMTGRQTGRLLGHKGPITAAAFSHDGRRLVVCSDILYGPAGDVPNAPQSCISLWDVSTKRLLWTLPGPGSLSYFSSVSFSPDGRKLAIGTDIRSTFILDAATGQLDQTLTVLQPNIRPTGTAEVVKAFFARITGRGYTNVLNNTNLAQIAYSPDGTLLATPGPASVILWSTSTWKQVRVLSCTTPVAFFPDGKQIATCDYPGRSGHSRIIVWDLK